MKPVLVCCLVVAGAAGCVTGGPWAGAAGSGGSQAFIAPAADASSPVTFPSPPQPPPDFGPRLIVPVTGGPPVMALPLGGMIYQPVTGDPPVTGIPVFP